MRTRHPRQHGRQTAEKAYSMETRRRLRRAVDRHGDEKGNQIPPSRTHLVDGHDPSPDFRRHVDGLGAKQLAAGMAVLLVDGRRDRSFLKKNGRIRSVQKATERRGCRQGPEASGEESWEKAQVHH